MPTFKAVVLKHQERQDGTWNAKIRLTHERKIAYFDTPYYLTKSQLTRDFKVKDEMIEEQLFERIRALRKKVNELGERVELFSAGELRDFLQSETSQAGEKSIDFIGFSQKYIDKIKTTRPRTAYNLQTTLNSLKDYYGSEKVSILQVNSKKMEDYVSFLKTERNIIRQGRGDILIKVKSQPLSAVSIFNYLTNIRTLFNAAVKEYNDDDKGEIRIKHYPFRKFKIVQPVSKRKRNVDIETIKQIRDTPDFRVHGSHNTNRSVLARDIFMLSFYLVGMNTVDLYKIDQFLDGRLEYNRSKTKGRRKDEAFISIKAEPEALHLIEKYRDPTGKRVFNFYRKYADELNFNKAVNKGLDQILERNNIKGDITFYSARHSWASIARNVCRIDKDDIAFCLNHSSSDHKVTDIYIEHTWDIIDQANRKVLDTLL